MRAANPSDVPHIAAIESASFSDPWPESAFADFLERSHARVSVAVVNAERVVGYCVLLVMADQGEIANIAVCEELRGKGVAAQLLDHAIVSARRTQVQAIYLEVRVSNRAARGLYESRGFKQVGKRRNYYSNPVEDALILRWDESAIFR